MKVFALMRTISAYQGYPVLRAVFANRDEAEKERSDYLEKMAEKDHFESQLYRDEFDIADDTKIIELNVDGPCEEIVFLLVERSEAFGQCHAKFRGAFALEADAQKAERAFDDDVDFACWCDIVKVELGVIKQPFGFLESG